MTTTELKLKSKLARARVRLADLEAELTAARETLAKAAHEQRTRIARLEAENKQLSAHPAHWAEVVDKRGQVIRSGVASEFSCDIVKPAIEGWSLMFLQAPVYSTTVYFLDSAEPYRVRTEHDERLIVREPVTE